MQTKLHCVHLEVCIFYLGLPILLTYAILNEKIKNYKGSQRNTAISKTIWRYLGLDENERVYKIYYIVQNIQQTAIAYYTV